MDPGGLPLRGGPDHGPRQRATVNECHDALPAAGKILLQCEGFDLFVCKFELHPLKK